VIHKPYNLLLEPIFILCEKIKEDLVEVFYKV